MHEHSDNATIRRALPGQIFSRTQIPLCLWFLAKNKNADAEAAGAGGEEGVKSHFERRLELLNLSQRKL